MYRIFFSRLVCTVKTKQRAEHATARRDRRPAFTCVFVWFLTRMMRRAKAARRDRLPAFTCVFVWFLTRMMRRGKVKMTGAFSAVLLLSFYEGSNSKFF